MLAGVPIGAPTLTGIGNRVSSKLAIVFVSCLSRLWTERLYEDEGKKA